MPQNPNQVYPSVATVNGVVVAKPQQADAQGVQIVATGGLSATLNVTAAAVIKASAGRIARVVILNAGTTGGGFVFNNVTTTGAATTANQVFNLPYNATNCYAGSVINLDIPCGTGIVLSAVPTGGSPQIVVTYN
jgi:hypothetical protein